MQDGNLNMLDRRRQVLWSYTSSENRAIAAMAVDDEGGVTVIDELGEVRRHEGREGRVLWRLPLESSLGPGLETSVLQLHLASDAHSSVIAVTTVRYNLAHREEVAPAHYYLLDGKLGACIWEDHLPSPSTGIAVSSSGVHTAISCRGGEIMLLSMNPVHDRGKHAHHRSLAIQTLCEKAYRAAERNRYDLVIGLMAEALNEDPANVVAASLYDEAVWCVREQAMENSTQVRHESLKKVEAALKLLPHDEHLTIRRNALARLLAERYVREGQARDRGELQEEKSIECYRKALDLDRSSIDARFGLRGAEDRYFRRLTKEADALLARQRHQEAIDLLERAFDLRAYEPGLEKRLSSAHSRLAFATGMQHYLQRRFPEAVFAFKKAISYHPGHPEATRYLHLAESFHDQVQDQPEPTESITAPEPSDWI
jgi:tetratricopeptide (TPR) repeat protein